MDIVEVLTPENKKKQKAPMSPNKEIARTDLLVCVFGGWCGAHKLREQKKFMFAYYLSLLFVSVSMGNLLPICIFWFYDIARHIVAYSKGIPVTGPGRVSREAPKELPSLSDELPIMQDSFVMLTAGEVCHYCEEATYVITKNVVVGYTGASSGVSVRVAKGVSYRTGSHGRSPIRDNVQEKHPGILSITNKRIVFTADKGSFDKQLSTLSTVAPYADAVIFQFGSTSYALATAESQYIYQLVSRLISQTSLPESDD